MQAVIVAGGLGTRLRPLTLTRPKALLPLVNRPQILHTLDRLPPVVDEVLVAVNYRFAEVRDFVAEHGLADRVTVVDEPVPLGTGGAVKSLASRLTDTFLVFNGDVVTSLDVEALLQDHRGADAVGTIAVGEVEDPSTFGVVRLDGRRIVEFVEKPERGSAPSRLANAGAYVLETEALDVMPAGREVSMEREVFPSLIPRGLRAYPFDGFWCDAGTLDNFLRASDRLMRRGPYVQHPPVLESGGSVLHPVAFGTGCRVAGQVGPSVVLGEGCVVHRAVLRDSTLLDRVVVEPGARVESSILGSRVTVGPDAVVRRSIVGDGAEIPGARTVVDARVSP